MDKKLLPHERLFLTAPNGRHFVLVFREPDEMLVLVGRAVAVLRLSEDAITLIDKAHP